MLILLSGSLIKNITACINVGWANVHVCEVCESKPIHPGIQRTLLKHILLWTRLLTHSKTPEAEGQNGSVINCEVYKSG